MDDIKMLIINLSNELPLTFEKSDKSFYDFVKKKFKVYENKLNCIEDGCFKSLLSKSAYFKEPYTKLRFINMINKINQVYIKILELCYRGELSDAQEKLKKLLFQKKFTGKKLTDYYFNSIRFKKNVGPLFRVRDMKKSEDIDLFHIPFELRYKSYPGRFSLYSYPCLYLADSEETAKLEVGKRKNNQDQERWLATFKIPHNKCCFINLTKLSPEEINNLTSHDIFCFLITYPLLILCLTEFNNDKKEERFQDEYLFSQQLLNSLFYWKKCDSMDFIGIAYTSTKNKVGVNYVIPAITEKKEVPINGHSSSLKKYIIEESKEKI